MQPLQTNKCHRFMTLLTFHEYKRLYKVGFNEKHGYRDSKASIITLVSSPRVRILAGPT
jgi:hypothetical protein